MEAGSAHRLRAPAIAQSEIRRRQAWDVAGQFVCSVPSRSPVVEAKTATPHQSQLAARNNAVSSRGISGCLPAPRAACDTAAKQITTWGENDEATRSLVALAAIAVAAAMVATTANAQKKYDTGASDTEIKIGNIMPYSGPASAYGTIGKAQAAYFNKINAEGGINGRKINFISYDDAFSPPKAVEQARKLVESDEVLLIFQPLGTPVQFGHPEIHERQESAAAVRRDRRHQVGRSAEFSVDHGLAAQLPERRPHLRGLYPEELSERQDRGDLAERRRRQGPDEGIARRSRQTRPI